MKRSIFIYFVTLILIFYSSCASKIVVRNDKNLFFGAIQFEIKDYNCDLGPFDIVEDKKFHIFNKKYETLKGSASDIEIQESLILVFLKIYYSHISCFNQSFNLLKGPYSLAFKDFFKLVKSKYPTDKEYQFLSSEVYFYTLKHKHLMNIAEINEMINKIKQSRLL